MENKHNAKVSGPLRIQCPEMVDEEDIRWEEANFSEKDTGWAEYEVDEGEIVRVRTVVAKIEFGINPETDERIILENGEPLVRLKAKNFVEVEEGDLDA